MPREEIIGEEPLSMGDLKKQLENIQKRDGDLNFRASRTMDYLNHVVSAKKSDVLFKQLTDLEIPRLKNVHITKIVDIMPATLDELKLALSGYIVTVNQENLKKIVTVLEEFRK